jgi:LCP family protein required for cell wall assembly
MTQLLEPIHVPVSSPGKRRAKKRIKISFGKVLTLSLLSLLLVASMSVAYILRDLQSSLGDVIGTEALKDRPFIAKEGAVNILIMGSDTREGENNIDGNTSGGQRSDTTILLHLAEDREQAYGVSIPRDTVVDRPDCNLEDGGVAPGESGAMWNEAFNVGGPLCTVQQFEAITDVYVDHFVVVEFDGFKDMVDALGGVEVCLAEPISDTAEGRDIYLPAGPQVVSGEDALNFVRVRHGVGNGSDIGRIKRQQAFVASMAKQVLSADTLSSPPKILKFLKAALASVRPSESLSKLRQIGALAFEFRSISFKKVQFITVPWEPDPTDPNRVIFKAEESAELFDRLRNDETLGKELGIGAVKASNPRDGDPENKGGKDDESAQEAADAGLCT